MWMSGRIPRWHLTRAPGHISGTRGPSVARRSGPSKRTERAELLLPRGACLQNPFCTRDARHQECASTFGAPAHKTRRGNGLDVSDAPGREARDVGSRRCGRPLAIQDNAVVYYMGPGVSKSVSRKPLQGAQSDLTRAFSKNTPRLCSGHRSRALAHTPDVLTLFATSTAARGESCKSATTLRQRR